MRELEKPIGRVWRRMRFQRFLAALVWCLGGDAGAGGGGHRGREAAPIGRCPGADWVPFAVAGGLGLVAAADRGAASGPSRVDAAVAIDRAFHLNERLSTALTLPDDLRETPAGRALIADAIRHVADLDVAAEFGLAAAPPGLGRR